MRGILYIGGYNFQFNFFPKSFQHKKTPIYTQQQQKLKKERDSDKKEHLLI